MTSSHQGWIVYQAFLKIPYQSMNKYSQAFGCNKRASNQSCECIKSGWLYDLFELYILQIKNAPFIFRVMNVTKRASDLSCQCIKSGRL